MNPGPSPDASLLSIQVAKPLAIRYMDREVRTGIFKLPVLRPVMVRRLNIDGDEQGDLSVHGGVDKAVYCYASEHYPSWQDELGRELPHGTFGENLTVAGLLEPDLHLGDVLEIGDAVLQVSQPRFPCYKLGIKIGDPRFVRRFQESGRSGFYCRVLQEGMIEAGQPVRLAQRDESQPTIADVVGARNQEA
jgi:MOSC domain-containing protein YiiM